jgi:hypothetical protein
MKCKEGQSLELHIFKHSQSLGSSNLELYKLSKAVILVCSHYAVQHESLACTCIFLQRGISDLWILIAVALTQGVVVLVNVFFIFVVKVHGIVRQTDARRTRSTCEQGQN